MSKVAEVSYAENGMVGWDGNAGNEGECVLMNSIAVVVDAGKIGGEVLQLAEVMVETDTFSNVIVGIQIEMCETAGATQYFTRRPWTLRTISGTLLCGGHCDMLRGRQRSGSPFSRIGTARRRGKP